MTEITDRQRSKDRFRRATITGLASTLARVVQAGTSFITIPLTLKYLGTERFGLWMAISSTLAMAAFADFGLGNGVLNTVATAHGKDDSNGVQQAISSGLAVLTPVALLIFCVYLLLQHYISWADFFHVVSPQARAEAQPAFAVFAICFVLNIPLDIVQRVQLGLQRGYRNGMWQLCGSLFGLTCVLIGIKLHFGLPKLVAGIAGAPLLATSLNTIHFFGFERKDLRPSFSCVSKEVIRELARLGGLFFVLQLAVALSYSADNFVIGRTLGAAHVANFSVTQKLFSVISMIGAMLLNPYWPAYAEAISRGDVSWARHTLKHTLSLTFAGAALASLTLAFLTRLILHLWAGDQIQPPMLLVIGLAVWTVMDCCGNCMAMFLNGAGVIRPQILLAIPFTIVCLSVKIFAVKRFGIVGIPWATAISYVAIVISTYTILVPRLLAQLQRDRHVAIIPPVADPSA